MLTHAKEMPDTDPTLLERPPAEGAIAVAATFTIDPVSESLEYWLDDLGLRVPIEIAPYNQVMQTLLDGQSVFARNRNGLNAVLVRFEDWERFRAEAGGQSTEPAQAAEAQNRDFIAALKSAAASLPSTILVCICPPSPGVSRQRRQLFFDLESELARELASVSSIRFVPSDRLTELYPVADYYDETADKLGHIPYTPEMYAALGTTIVRVFHASKRAPYKVVVLDCDNTLWRGVCGEKGPHGVEIDGPSRALQLFMKARQQEGMLLCVCSKNVSEDVEQTFEAHPDMPIGRSMLVGWKVNWNPKSENIQALAKELSLGLDSFIFVDDNPMETAEVEARCPGVLALTLPESIEQIPHYLDHIWAFDNYGITVEDRERTAMYRQNTQRDSLLAQSASYAEFLDGLNVEIEIREPLGDKEISRSAQMTQRTNQFNFTTRRFSEPEIRQMLQNPSMGTLTTFVRDRFGDYGQVGLVQYEEHDGVLRVVNFLLSCRVLGKGVEHRMAARLGEIALAKSLATVEIPFIETAKNTPARNFLMKFDAHFREEQPSGFRYLFPASVACGIRFAPGENPDAAPVPERASPDKPRSAPPTQVAAVSYDRIATERSNPAAIVAAVVNSRKIHSAGPVSDLPRSDLERQLTRIWERALRISPLGIHDSFFELSGDSILAVRIFVDIKALTGRELPLVTLFEAPTIAKLAALLANEAWNPHWNSLVPIKSTGSRPPFYCVHGVGGNILEFMDLARYVSADQPLFGIQAVGLNGKGARQNLTVEQMAERYLEEIREFQPEGPYYIGGSSFGGLVAYEMARQLTAKGEMVALVALFDTYGPGYPKMIPSTGWEKKINRLKYRFGLHWSNIRALQPGERGAFLKDKTKRVLRRIQFQGKVIRHSLRDRWRRMWLPQTIRAVNQAGHWAAADYVPGQYSGCVTIFRATGQPLGIVEDQKLGWGDLVKGGVDIYHTPGHHGAIVRDPRARTLAQQLDDALAKARARTMVSSRASLSGTGAV